MEVRKGKYRGHRRQPHPAERGEVSMDRRNGRTRTTATAAMPTNSAAESEGVASKESKSNIPTNKELEVTGFEDS